MHFLSVTLLGGLPAGPQSWKPWQRGHVDVLEQIQCGEKVDAAQEIPHDCAEPKAPHF